MESTEKHITILTVDGTIQITSENIKNDLNSKKKEVPLKSIINLLTHGSLNGCVSSRLDVTSISSLNLSNCNLTELPKDVAKFNLKTLILCRNKFKLVPSCIFGGLKELTTLDLSFNLIQQFDIEPDCITHLKTLKLNDNQLENIPKWFLTFRCTNLETLDYSNNQANHYNYLKKSFNLPFMKLKNLHLRNSCLLDSDFTLIKQFRNLQTLELSNNDEKYNRKYINNFKDLDMLFVKPDWTKIQILYLNHLSIGFFPEGIYYLESLKELHITNNTLSWLPDGIEYLINLEVLDISNNEVVALPTSINSLECLKIFRASSNCIDALIELPKSLVVIDLYDNCIDELKCDINCVQFVDLEYNHVSDRYLNDKINGYCLKRDSFRHTYNLVNERINGVKEKLLNYSSSSSSPSEYSVSESEIENYANVSITYSNNDENWDDELSQKPIIEYADIGLSDEEWRDDECPLLPKAVLKSKVYVDDNDWCFIDAD